MKDIYRPIVAAFMLAILAKRSGVIGVKTGIIAGILMNIILWVWLPQAFHSVHLPNNLSAW